MELFFPKKERQKIQWNAFLANILKFFTSSTINYRKFKSSVKPYSAVWNCPSNNCISIYRLQTNTISHHSYQQFMRATFPVWNCFCQRWATTVSNKLPISKAYYYDCFFFNKIMMLQIICSEHQTNVICVAKTERVLWLRWKIAEVQKLQDFCVVTVTIRVLWAPTREQNCKSVRGGKKMHSFSGFGFGSCLSVSCDWISAVKLLRGVVSLSFCQMTENPSGLAEGGEIKVEAKLSLSYSL